MTRMKLRSYTYSIARYIVDYLDLCFSSPIYYSSIIYIENE